MTGGHRLIAYEVAGREHTYPWSRSRNAGAVHVDHAVSRPGRRDDRSRPLAAEPWSEALDRDQPDGARSWSVMRVPNRWRRRGGPDAAGRPAILMSESQAIDRPHAWWKELIKMRRVRQFDAALVGGPGHRDYLAQLGMPPDRIALGYNAVDNDVLRDQGHGSGSRAPTSRSRPARPLLIS